MKNQYNFYNLEALFKEYLLSGNKIPTYLSIKNYLSDLRHFLGWFVLKTKTQNSKLKIENNFFISILSQITINIIEEYKSYLVENKIPIKTINRRLSTLRKFCSFCISQGWLKENPAKKISNISKTNEEVLNRFEQDLKKEITEPRIIKSYLDDIQEFLSL